MEKCYYILVSEYTFSKGTDIETNSVINGIFDDIDLARAVANKILARTKKFVGEENVRYEDLLEMRYRTEELKDVWLRMTVKSIYKINEESL